MIYTWALAPLLLSSHPTPLLFISDCFATLAMTVCTCTSSLRGAFIYEH